MVREGASRSTNNAERYPEDCRINRQSEGEVRDEAVLTDLDPVGKAALNHVPAERALRKTQ